MLEPFQLLEMTMYTNILSKMSERASKDMGIEIILVMLVYVLYKIIPVRYYENLHEKIGGEESYIIIESHRKKYYTNGYPIRESVKVSYSERFKALHHYLLHNCEESFPHVYEIMEILEKSSQYNHIEEYILIPYENKKVKINKKRNISVEMSKKKIDGEGLDNEYKCKISTNGLNPKVLYEFLEECISGYNEYKRKRNNVQSIYEYSKSEQDEDGNRTAKYNEVPFISNKHLKTNIYFPEKESFMKELDKFVHNKEIHKKEYEECGQTYKLTMVLHGEPGTGKTSIVRGMLNYTGRDAVVVPWCNIKTCGDLASILRCNVYNGKKKELKDLIFIFEDFDANMSKILKTRKHPIQSSTIRNNEKEITELVKNIEDKANEVNTPKEILEEIKKLQECALTSMFHHPIEDELTLEYVLNILDGIVENHEAIIVFTTNHLEEIDPALIRPGRVDYKLELKNATVNTIKEMVSKKYKLRELTDYNEYFMKMSDYLLSPAEVQNEIFMRDDVLDCLNNLLCKYNSKTCA